MATPVASHISEIIEDLRSLGLSETEARLYVALIGRGTGVPRELAFDAGIKRTTVYPALETLREKGLVTADTSRGRQRFVAAPLGNLKRLLREKMISFGSTLDKISTLESSLPQGSAQVQFYRGRRAVRSAYEGVLDRLKPSHYYWALGHQDLWLSSDKEYFGDFKVRRSRTRADVRLLLLPSPSKQREESIGKQLGEKLRFLPPFAEVSSNTVVTPFCYLLHSLGASPYVVVIEIPAIVSTQAEYFKMLWGVSSATS